MNTKENRNSAWQTENYQQLQVDEEDQTMLLDQTTTAETDELNPAFNLQGPPVDPEDEEEEDDDFPTREDLEEDDFDLNRDQDDDLSLNIDDEELN